MPSRAAAAADASTAAGAVVTISLGRPVLPPLATAFSSGDMLGVKRPAGSSAGTDSSAGQPPASGSGTPTTSDGRATSRRAARSAAGSRLEMGCGTAPTPSGREGQDRGAGQYAGLAGRVPFVRNAMVARSAQAEPVP